MAAPPAYFKRTLDTFEFSEQGDPQPSSGKTTTKKKGEGKTKQAKKKEDGNAKKIHLK